MESTIKPCPLWLPVAVYRFIDSDETTRDYLHVVFNKYDSVILDSIISALIEYGVVRNIEGTLQIIARDPPGDDPLIV